MRTDQPPFNDVRVRRAISHALDQQGIIEAELKLQEYGAYMATTAYGKYEGMVYAPTTGARDLAGVYGDEEL